MWRNGPQVFWRFTDGSGASTGNGQPRGMRYRYAYRVTQIPYAGIVLALLLGLA